MTDGSQVVGYDCPYCGARLTVAPEATHCKCKFCDATLEIRREGMYRLEEPKSQNTYPVQGRNSETTRKAVTVLVTVLFITFICCSGILGKAMLATSSRSSYTSESKPVTKTVLDVKKELNVYVTGMEGYGKACVNLPYSSRLSGMISDVDYEPHENLKNGDVIHIKAILGDDYVDSKYYDFENLEYDYTVSGLNRFVTDLSSEDTFEEDLKVIALKSLEDKNFLKDGNPLTATYEYEGYIICNSKTDTSSFVALVYSMSLSDGTVLYIPISFNNVYADADNNVLADYSPKFNGKYASYGDITSKAYFSYNGYDSLHNLILDFVNNNKSKYEVYTNLE